MDDNIVDRKIFYIDGKMYDADDFRGIYENLMQRLKIKDTEGIKWKEQTNKEKVRNIMSVWILGMAALVLQVMCIVLF